MKNLLRIGAVFCIVFFIFEIGSVYGDDSSLWIKGITVKLGMTREDIKKQVTTGVQFGPISSGKAVGEGDESSETWVIYEKKPQEFTIFGTAIFDSNGRAASVHKAWGDSNNSETYSFVKDLFGVLASLTQTPQKATIATSTQHYAGGEMSFIRIYFSGRKIEVILTSDKTMSKMMSISESIGRF